MAAFLSAGPFFVSGTVHKLLQLGEQPTDSPPPVHPTVQVPAYVPTSEPSPTTSAGKKRKLRQSSEEPSDLYSPSPVGPTTSNRSKSTGGTTLYEMIEAGVLQPGIDNATVTYKGSTYAGSLQANGTIFFRGIEFNTPSAFSVYVKRLITPNKQGDDGWHSVSIDGVMLHHLRTQYLQQKQQQQDIYGQQGGVLPPLPAAKRAGSNSKGGSKQKIQRVPSPRPSQQYWQQQSPASNQYAPSVQQQQRAASPPIQQQQVPQQQPQPKPSGMQFKLHIKPPRPLQLQQSQQQQPMAQPPSQVPPEQQQAEHVVELPQPQQSQQQQATALTSEQRQREQQQPQQQQEEQQPVQGGQQLQQQPVQSGQQQQPHQPVGDKVKEQQQQQQQRQQEAPSNQPPSLQPQPQQQQQQSGPPPLKKLKLGKVHLPAPRPAGKNSNAGATGIHVPAHGSIAAAAVPAAPAPTRPVIKLAIKPSSAALAVAAAFPGGKRGPSAGFGIKGSSGGFGIKIGLGAKSAAGGLKGKGVGADIKASAAGVKAAAGGAGSAANGKAIKHKVAGAGKAGPGKAAAGSAVKTGSAGKAGKGSAAGKSSAAPQQQPQQRVQCSRCEVWRTVPAKEWEQLKADKKDEWFCEDASWELTDYEPFTPGCLSDMWAEGEP